MQTRCWTVCVRAQRLSFPRHRSTCYWILLLSVVQQNPFYIGYFVLKKRTATNLFKDESFLTEQFSASWGCHLCSRACDQFTWAAAPRGLTAGSGLWSRGGQFSCQSSKTTPWGQVQKGSLWWRAGLVFCCSTPQWVMYQSNCSLTMDLANGRQSLGKSCGPNLSQDALAAEWPSPQDSLVDPDLPIPALDRAWLRVFCSSTHPNSMADAGLLNWSGRRSQR